MTTHARKLLSLEVEHDYHGGVCPDVAFAIPDDVAQVLKGARHLVRGAAGALQVFYAAKDNAGAPLASVAGKTLRIGLVSPAADFANITEGFDPAAGALLYRNVAAAGALDAPSRLLLVGRSFSRPLARTERPVTVTLRDAAGRPIPQPGAHLQPVPSQTITAADRTSVSFDLAGAAPGAITIEEAYPGEVVHTARYLDPVLSRERAFGVVEIRVDASFYARPPRFTVSLGARRETLRYYVVARGFSVPDAGLFGVFDRGAGDPDRPDALTFKNVPPDELTPDERARTEMLAEGGARVLLFRSEAAVARREKGRKRIQLTRNGEVLVEHLPQPGRGQSAADLIIHLSKSKP